MGGVTGFRKSGVKEVTYKLVFIACSVQQSDAKGGNANGLLVKTRQKKNVSLKVNAIHIFR